MKRFPFSFKSATAKATTAEASLQKAFLISKDELKWEPSVPAIGHGGSATVFIGSFKARPVAIKVYNLDNFMLPSNQRLLMNEVEELVKLNHKHIISCYGVCLERGAIVLELCEKKIPMGPESAITVHSLRQFLDVAEVPMGIKLEALFQVAIRLEYLHCNQIIHGDLKSANVLVHGSEVDEYLFKLSDLGQKHSDIAITGTNIHWNKSCLFNNFLFFRYYDNKDHICEEAGNCFF